MVAIGGSIIRIQNRAYSVRRAVKLSRWLRHLDRSRFWRFRIMSERFLLFSHARDEKTRDYRYVCRDSKVATGS